MVENCLEFISYVFEIRILEHNCSVAINLWEFYLEQEK